MNAKIDIGIRGLGVGACRIVHPDAEAAATIVARGMLVEEGVGDAIESEH
jgi:hypothetical protein